MENITTLADMLPRYVWELAVAIVCGGLIGLERVLHHKAAGLRDNILICLGSVLFMKVSELVAIQAGNGAPADPGRIAAQVVTGIGFIGAGAIIQRRGDITGITTAATIWVVAGIGLTIGAGYPLLALMVTGAVLLILTAIRGVEQGMLNRHRPLLLRLTVRSDSPELRSRLSEILEKEGVQPRGFRAEESPLGVKLTVRAEEEPTDIRRMMTRLWTLEGVIEAEH